METLDVVAGILVHDRHILCVQRGKAKYTYVSYKYEFPGGKIEHGETPEAALHRELLEELNKDVTVNQKDLFIVHKHVYKDFAVTLHFYLCYVTDRALRDNEHVDIKWLTQDELGTLDWAEADKHIIAKLQEADLK